MKRRLPWSLGIAAVCIAVSLCAHAQEAEPFWDKTDGPHGEALWTLLVTAGGDYYGGTGTGEIYRKLAGEDKWKVVYTTDQTILTLYEYQGKVYFSDDGGALMYSEDRGDTWIAEKAGFTEEVRVRSLCENKNGDLFAGTSEGVYKRTLGKEGAMVWRLKPIVTQFGSFVFSLTRDKAGVMYAGTGRGIYRSDDDGETWTLSGLAETADAVMSLDADAQGNVYAGTMDAGLLVNKADDGKPDGWESMGAGAVAGGVRKVSVVNGTELFVYVTSSGLFYSADGTSWQQLFTKLDCRAGTFTDPLSGQLVTGTFNGVWTSPQAADGFDYRQRGIPYDISRLYSYQSRIVAIANGNTRIFTSDDQGETWDFFFSNGEGIVTCYAEKDNEDKFVGCDGGFNGRPWIQAEIFVEWDNERGPWSIGFPADVNAIADILITAKDSIYVGTDDGLYYIAPSKDYEAIRLSKIGTGIGILMLKEDRQGNLYAATNDGVYVSSDNGFNWQTHLLDGIYVSEIVLHEDHLLAATPGGLYDVAPGAAPVLVDVGGGSAVTSVAADDHGHVYVATGKGVYYADNLGTGWTLQEGGAEGYSHLRLHKLDNQVYLATDAGVYKHAYAQRATITLSGLGSFDFTGAAHAATATTNPAGLPVTILYNGQEAAPVDGGTYQVTAIVNDENYAGQRKGRIDIGKADATVTLSGLGIHYYNGRPAPVTATTSPAGLPVIIRYNGKTDVPVEIGEYDVAATIDHPSYRGQAAGDLVILDPVLGTEDPGNKLVRIYPVPARTGITVESGTEKIRSIAVYNTLGTLVDQVAFTTPVSRHDLGTAAYPAGVLVVMITTDKHARVAKRAELIR